MKVLADVSIVARSETDEESCVSDSKGNFRLRNLKPEMTYTLSVVITGSTRASWPLSQTVTIQKDASDRFQDVHDIKFTVFK